MNPDPLAGLRPWHEPPPVSWWPPAPGWWLLAALLCLALALVARHWWRARHARTLSRAALAEFLALRARCRTGALERRACLAALSALLRRLALALYPRAQVAGLSGRRWLAFLDATGGGGAFGAGAGRVLIEDALRPESVRASGDELALWMLAEHWIRAQSGRGRSSAC